MTAPPDFRPFALKRPCGDCPFRNDRQAFLGHARAQEIADSLEADASFHCHKTLAYDNEDGTPKVTKVTKHCAGALIIRISMREVTCRTFPDGTFVLEVTTTPGPVVHLAVIEPEEATAAA